MAAMGQLAGRGDGEQRIVRWGHLALVVVIVVGWGGLSDTGRYLVAGMRTPLWQLWPRCMGDFSIFGKGFLGKTATLLATPTYTRAAKLALHSKRYFGSTQRLLCCRQSYQSDALPSSYADLQPVEVS